MSRPRVKGNKAQPQALQFLQHLLGPGTGLFDPVPLELTKLLLELTDQIIPGQHIHFLGVDLLGKLGTLFLDALLQSQLVLLSQHLQLTPLGLALLALLLKALGQGNHLGFQ